MRADMSKLIVERPRRGGRGARKGRALDLDDLPARQGIARPYADRKSLNENLAPLRRFLRARVGRHWDKVYAEISAHLRPSNTVQQHVRDHLADFVALHVVRRDGELHVQPGRGRWRPGGNLADSAYEFYVHPVSGVLLANRKRRTWSQTGRERRRREEARVALRRRELGGAAQLHRIEGIWFEVTLAPISAERAPTFRDAVLDASFTVDRAAALYGRRGVFALCKRQLGRDELRRHGLENDAPDL